MHVHSHEIYFLVSQLISYLTYIKPCHIGTQDDRKETTTSVLRDGSSDNLHRLEYIILTFLCNIVLQVDFHQFTCFIVYFVILTSSRFLHSLHNFTFFVFLFSCLIDGVKIQCIQGPLYPIV